MCFSAPASFLTAAFTGAAGVAAVRRTTDWREIPLASVPLFFALQQAVEGALWLSLPLGAEDATCQALTHAFLIFALLFWPVFAPLAAYFVEPDPKRRRAIAACLAVGLGVSAYLLSVLIGSTHQALLKAGHIVYETEPPPNGLVGIFYLVATGLGPAFSSHRAVNLLSIIVVIGSVVAWLAYWEAFVSVWCFFAAAASTVIVLHFVRSYAIAAPPGAAVPK